MFVGATLAVEEIGAVGFDLEIAEAAEFFGRVGDEGSGMGFVGNTFVRKQVLIGFRNDDGFSEVEAAEKDGSGTIPILQLDEIGGAVIDGGGDDAVYDGDVDELFVELIDGFGRRQDGGLRNFGLCGLITRCGSLEGLEGECEVAIVDLRLAFEIGEVFQEFGFPFVHWYV